MTTVPSKVQSFREMKNFGQNFPIFLLSLSIKMAIFGRTENLNHVFDILVLNKSLTLESGNSTLRRKLDQTFFELLKPLGKFFIKICIWANLHLLKI